MQTDTTAEPRRCRCGHTKDHKKVSPESIHGVFGYLRLMIGGTPVPRMIRFRCRDCDQVIEESTDPRVLGQYM